MFGRDGGSRRAATLSDAASDLAVGRRRASRLGEHDWTPAKRAHLGHSPYDRAATGRRLRAPASPSATLNGWWTTAPAPRCGTCSSALPNRSATTLPASASRDGKARLHPASPLSDSDRGGYASSRRARCSRASVGRRYSTGRGNGESFRLRTGLEGIPTPAPPALSWPYLGPYLGR